MEKIKNLSLRKTIILYMVIAITAGFFLGALVMRVSERLQDRIWMKYIDQDTYMEMQHDSNIKGYQISAPRPASYEMSDWDHRLSEICDFLETYSILVFSIIGTIAAIFCFYKRKISGPLIELQAASERIAQNELDFKILYRNRDELGTLCSQFEVMRQTLYENNLSLWKMVEEQKTLRAAIAHDIRSPLAVLRGYQEMMLEFVPEDRFEKTVLIEMLKDGMKQIDGLNRFVESMRTVSSLEERKVNRELNTLDSLKYRIKQNVLIYEKNTGKKSEIQFDLQCNELTMDEDLIVEVVENLLANAFLYANEKVTLCVAEKDHMLEIVIEDDGCGFSEETENLTKAYYHSNPQDDLEHFGLGMYISRLYCEKHGGKLLTGNKTDGGAVVKALFAISPYEA